MRGALVAAGAVEAMMTLRHFPLLIPYNRAGPGSYICTRSRLAFLEGEQ